MAKKNVIPIAVDPEAKAVITAIAKRHDMKEIGVASRIYKWFSKQPDVVQKAVLDLLPEGYEGDVIRIALERIAKEKEKGKR